MKRINPDTNKVFKQGDKRPSTDKQDGRIFYSYDSRKERMKNGFFAESWRTQKAYDKKKTQDKDKAYICCCSQPERGIFSYVSDLQKSSFQPIVQA